MGYLVTQPSTQPILTLIPSHGGLDVVLVVPSVTIAQTVR